MTKDNFTQLVIVLAALVVALISALWPTEAGTWNPIIVNQVIPVLCLLVAIFFPAGKAVGQIYAARARAAYWGAVKAGKAQAPAGAALDNGAQTQIDDLLKTVYTELDTDQVTYKDDQGNIDPVPIAPRLARELANRWNDEANSIAFRQVLLQTTVAMASKAFTAATNLPAPATYTEVAAPQTYWLNHKVGCAVNSAGLFHQILMPLRIALKIRDTGNL